MPTWKKGAREFSVRVNRVKKDVKVTLPKPVDGFLGDPDIVTFRISKSGRVTLDAEQAKEKKRK